ncbi:unnamed protein product [Rhizoctonia solani]|uniref:37S ribosomal protein S35, mitochondrial n=1 Tax=Rhizoctonia solani TaxID=456999 RepID=A0A8H3E2B9_9AGAM|nr:unnamed protein product [Rhizoctonia solani]
MLSPANARVLPFCSARVHSSLRAGQTRTFFLSRFLRNEDSGGEDSTLKKGKQAKVDPQTVESWFRDEGLPYLNPTPGKPNWLGGDIPYPDNPTFKPPPPLSDVVKSSIYDRYLKALQPATSKSESRVQTIRTLSEQFGISIARVEAIVRLKEFERQYQKGKKLQYAFQRGMESYLGIHPERDRALVSDFRVISSDINAARQRTAEVDNEAQVADKDHQKGAAARRVWWEMVEDVPDSQPVVPGIVAKGLEKYRNKLSEDQRAHAGVSLHVDGPVPPTGKPRTVFTFVDTSVRGPAKKARA